MKYEEAIKRLREICECLRDENTTLEETAKLYKEGMKLAEDCKMMLDKISVELGGSAEDE